MARHEPGWVCGSHTGSDLRLLSRSLCEPLLGVMVSMTCPSVKASPCQWKWASRSPGRGWCGPRDDETQPRLIQGRQVGRREHAGVGDHHKLLNVVGGLEGLHDGNDRGGLGLVALPAADLERKTGPVDQQSDDDLRIDPPLLGVTDLAQVVLTLGLEIEGGHACRHRARPLVAVT